MEHTRVRPSTVFDTVDISRIFNPFTPQTTLVQTTNTNGLVQLLYSVLKSLVLRLPLCLNDTQYIVETPREAITIQYNYEDALHSATLYSLLKSVYP